MSRALDLRLPEPERRRAADLVGGWRDFLYVPGPGFASPLEPALYRSSFVIVPADGRALRMSSFVVPAFGGELCRLRLEPLVSFRPENLGSFFEPSRRGMVYALSRDRRGGAARPPVEPGWSYDGPSLRPRLVSVGRLRVLREHVRGASGGESFSWAADRGVVLTGADGSESLLLATPESSEQAILVSAVGLHRALLEPAAPETPGATVRELLGYGDWEARLEIIVELEDLAPLP